MANEKHLTILRKGTGLWNRWRVENTHIQPDLSEAYLYSQNLNSYNLNNANLHRANLINADLTDAELRYTDLSMANLKYTNLTNVDLCYANLTGSNLMSANISNASLVKTLMEHTFFNYTVIADVDLSQVVGLENIIHRGPSEIGQLTLNKSRGRIPEIFLKGCGLTKWEIACCNLYNPELSSTEITDIVYKIDELKNANPIQFTHLFLSYSHKDGKFVDQLENYLLEKNISFWRDIHNPISGKLEQIIERAMRVNQIVIVVLSRNSIASDWVKYEVRRAIEMERKGQRNVMCPLALDNSWETAPWPARMIDELKEYNILDFSNWEKTEDLDSKFNNMIKGLSLFYKR